MLDNQFCVQYLNEAAESLLQTSVKRSIGVALSTLVKDDDQLLTACQRALEHHCEIRLRNHLMLLPAIVQEKTINCIVTPFEQDREPHVLLECQENEALVKITRDEEFMERQHSNRELIRGMAHEIRNPLGGIRGAAQLMAEETGSEQFLEYTRIIIQETDRLTELVNRMQADARVDLDQSINIHSVIEDVRHLVEAENNGRLSIQQDYDPSLPNVKGNRDLLVQALLNVIRNAVEAVDSDSGEIILRTRIDRLTSDMPRKQVVRVEVQDNGAGVPAELTNRIFDPMVTSKPTGSGLGLPITAEIITRLDGVMDFKTRPGKTVFRLYLPVFERNEGVET